MSLNQTTASKSRKTHIIRVIAFRQAEQVSTQLPLRHRQFGVLVTTSYVHEQAYREIKEDGHPVIIILARDIVNVLKAAGFRDKQAVNQWLEDRFPSDK